MPDQSEHTEPKGDAPQVAPDAPLSGPEGAPPTAEPPSSAAGTPPPANNRRTLWIALGVIAALVVLVVVWRNVNTVTVPRVVGLSQAQASQELEAAGLQVGTVSEEATLAAEPGTVIAQSPLPETDAPKDSRVALKVAAIPSVQVPDVVGMSESEAEAELAVAGLRAGEITGSFSADTKPGLVMSQSPGASEEVLVGSQVAMEISLGAEKGAVPDVVGLSSTDAEEVLTTAGFDANQAKSTSEDVEAGVVMSQSPSAGTVAEAGSSVKITVSSGPPAQEPAPEEPAAEEPAPEEPATEPTPPPSESKPEPKPPAPKPEAVQVPDVVGMRALEALKSLRDVKLGFKIEWGPTEEGVLTVIEQDPSAGSDAEPGDVVTITIGLPAFLFGDVEIQPLPTEPPATPDVEAPATPDVEAPASTPTTP